jgi:large repetitive protein
MKKYILIFLSIFMFTITARGQGATCAQATQMCGTTPAFAGIINSTISSIPDPAGCLSTTPNESWFFFNATATGNIAGAVTSNGPARDIDGAIWGPYTSVAAACADLTDGSIPNPKACDYSGISSVPFNFTVNQGIYVLVVSNFSNQPTFFDINFTSGNSLICCPPTVTVNNACIGGGTQTFSTNGATGGTWSVTGGGNITSAGVFTPTNPGCYSATYTVPVTGCIGTNFFIVFPRAPAISAPSNTCASAFQLPGVAPQNGFTVQYSIDGAAFSATPTIPTTPGCHTIKARYILTATCGTNAAGSVGTGVCGESNTVSVVIFPSAPTLAAVANSCNSALTLPAVAPVAGFNVAYSIDNGPFTVTNTGSSTPGCHNIRATYLLATACGSTPAGTQGSAACNFSNTQNATVFPAAPPAPTASLIGNNVTVNQPTTVAGFDIQYSFDDGTSWSNSNIGPSADNCTGYKVKTRYVAQGCGTSPSLTPSTIPACSASTATTVIKDTTPPAITCPTNVVVSPAAGSCNTNVPNIALVATDNCGLAAVTWVKTGATTGTSISTGINNASGTNFNQGITTVTYTATDANGNSSTCSFTVTVNNLPPTITCPSPIITSAGADCKKIVNGIGPAAAADNCAQPTVTFSISGATTATGANDASGTVFEKGISTVTYTATDAQGATTTCSFTVTVNDTTPPVITCPPNQIIELTATCQSTMPDYTTQATKADNCGVISTTQTPAIGSIITGTAAGNNYTVTLTATDAAGNSSTCSFQVTVIDNTPVAVNCLAAQNLQLSLDCSATLPDYRSLIQPTNLCTPPSNIIITQTPAPGTVVTGVGPLTVTFTATITGTSKSSTCETTVNKIDITKPTITCPANVSANTSVGTCTTAVPNIGATATDGCAVASVSYIISGATNISSPLSGINDASGTTFNKGISTVNYLAKDASGNEIGCSFTVTVNDAELPVIACPANVSTSTTAGLCTAVVTYSTPVGTDNCLGAVTTQTAGLASGSVFPIGSTTNTYLVTDASGNTASCSFIVIVNDIELPQITCPSNISQNADAGTCGAVVNFTNPLGTDNCTGAVTTQTAGLGTGVLYPIGTTVNTYLVTDGSGNTASCSFTVTIIDNIAPTISCPANITQNVDAGNCTAVVTFTPPIGNDNCPSAITTQIAGLASGAVYPIGTTTNTYSVTDAAGNTITCSFTITIVDNIAPTIACPENISQNVDAGLCIAKVNFTPPIGLDNCPGSTTIQLAGLASGADFPVGNTINTYEVTDAAGNKATCSFTIIVTDNILPTIACPANITQNVDAGNCNSVVNFTSPIVTDNCPGENTIQTDGLPSGSVFPIGTTTNTYLVTDAAGNTASCSFTITIVDNILPTIICPTNIAQNVDAGLCTSIVNYASLSINDNCPGANLEQTTGLASGSAFPVGVNVNTFKVTDAAGNTATCSFTITITDNILPTITCPDNKSQNVDAGLCTAKVTYTPPVGLDNCPMATTAQISGLASGADFPVGNTINIYEVTDAAGNKATCSFTITVIDNILPSIVCPANITQNVDVGLCTAEVIFTTPEGIDNCPNVVTEQIAGLPAGSAYPVGITTNTYRVTDDAGNSVTCSFTVTVVDNILPTIICPANISQTVDAGNCTALVTFTPPNGTDNCPGANTLQISGLASGATYPIGTTTNVFSVTDAAGNSATCSFTVTITDNIAPTIVCPADLILSTGSDCKSIVNNIAPVSVNDNCSIDNVTYTITGATLATGNNDASGTIFEKGISTITYLATDVNGNTATCSFTVTVNDTTPPVILCPPAQVIELTATCQSTMPNYTTQAIVSDNCSAPTVSQTPAIGSVIMSTTTGNNYTVTLTATDETGNSSTCSFQVTVVDNTPLAVNCLAAQNLELSLDCSVELPDYRSLILPTNLCTPAADIVIIQNPAPGTVVTGVGPLTVTFTASITGSTKTSTCETIINKIDVTKPNIVCPSNVIVNTAMGICTAQVPSIAANATDGCGIVSVSYIISGATNANSPLTGINDASGTIFNKGVSTINYFAKDASGNEINCSFTVTVNDTELPLITCPDLINIPNDEGQCGAIANYEPIIGTDNCPDAVKIQTSGLASGAFFPIGTTTNTFEVTDASGNKSTCSFTVTINDKEAPKIICLDDIIINDDPGKCGAIVTYLTPIGTDNCTGAITTQIAGLASGSEFPKGTTVNTFMVTDAAGNTATCSFNVTITDNEKPEITVCPAPITVECASDLPLPITTVADFEAAGGMVSDNCTANSNLIFAYLDAAPIGDLNCEFNVLRTYTITDESGNAISCSQFFTVDRTKVPIVPNNGFSEVQCKEAAVTPTLPIVNDACGNPITPTLLSTVENPNPIICGGTKIYTYSFKDCAGLESIWKFEYLIKDIIKPTATNPLAITVECTLPEPNIAVVTDAADNCDLMPVVSFVEDVEISSTNNNTEKIIERSYSVKDCSGNEIIVKQTINVKDTTPPIASNPAPISILCYEAVPMPDPSVVVDETDNCSTPTVIYKDDDITTIDCNSATPFTIIRTYGVTDAAGNFSTVTQQIIVNPVAKPAATDDISALTNPGQVASIPLLPNDKKGVDGDVPMAGDVMINLIPPSGSTVNMDGSITIPNQGTYMLDNTGTISFTPIPSFTGDPTPLKYTITELLTGLVSNEATITPDYAALPPVIVLDANTAPTTAGINTEVYLLGNDKLSNGTTPVANDVAFTLIPPANGTLNADGLSIEILDQGTYSLDPSTGIITFDPLAGFSGDPTPISYTITDLDNGAISEPATITMDYFQPLPVNLISFKAINKGESIDLTWRTSDMKYFSHFEILKSDNGFRYEPIGKVLGSNSEKYLFVDINPVKGVSYYKLKMIDLDGSFKYSNTVFVKVENEKVLTIIQNPAINGEFKVVTNITKPNFELLDSSGRSTSIAINNNGNDTFTIITKAPAGIYFLIIKNEKTIHNYKVILD